MTLSPAWRNAPAASATSVPWWCAFKDPILDQLESEALASNLDLEQALARVAQVRGKLKGADAALLPSGEVDASYARVRQSLNSGLGQLSGYVPGYPRTIDNAQIQLSASWEIDFVGGLRREREAARAQVRESLASYEAGRIAISAEVADAYWALRGAQAQAVALSQLIELEQAKAGFAVARVRAGDLASEVSPRATAAVENLTAQRPAFDALVEAQRDRIAVLLARDPSASFPELVAAAPIPDAPDPAARQNADILRRRPDVLAAENQLIAANAGIGITLAEYYPKVTLSSLLGQGTNEPAFLTSNASNFAQGAAGLRWRLFDFVRIDAEVRVAHGREREARAAYRQAVLLAAESVETSFAQLASARSRLTRLVAERVALANALAAEGRALAVGESSREAFVTSEQSVAQIDLELATARQAVMRATVACERAMGGSTGQNDRLAEGLSSPNPGPAIRTAQ